MNQQYPPLTVKMRKFYASLSSVAARNEHGLFLAEGEHLVAEVLKSNLSIECCIIQQGKSFLELEDQLHLAQVPVYSIAPEHIHVLADTQHPQGIFACCAIPQRNLEPNAPVLLLDAVADPGNVGTIIRTAEWFGVTNIVIGTKSADTFNPKVLRASMGSALRSAVIKSDIAEYLQSIKGRLTSIGAVVRSEYSLQQVASSIQNAQFALVLGSEAHGIAPEITNMLDATFHIPGNGPAESLNVAAAAAVALYQLTQSTAKA